MTEPENYAAIIEALKKDLAIARTANADMDTCRQTAIQCLLEVPPSSHPAHQQKQIQRALRALSWGPQDE